MKIVKVMWCIRTKTIIHCLALAITYFGVLMGPVLAQSAADREAIAKAISNGDYGTALQLLQPALAKSPNDSELWTMQGVAYDRQGNSRQALTSFQKGLRISPDYIPALEGAIQIL